MGFIVSLARKESKMKSFFDYFTQNKIDASWAYILICAIPVTIALMVYLWMRMVRVTDPDEDATISIEEAYVDAYVNDEMVSSADEGGLSDAPGTKTFNREIAGHFYQVAN